jgi:hypothetical protein
MATFDGFDPDYVRHNAALARAEAEQFWPFRAPYLACGPGWESMRDGWASVTQYNNTCPVWGDELPEGSVTIIIPVEDEYDARLACRYQYGATFPLHRKVMADGRIALRWNRGHWERENRLKGGGGNFGPEPEEY